MNLLNTDLCNKIGDDFLNDDLICRVEKKTLMGVKIVQVIERFRKMGKRRGQL